MSKTSLPRNMQSYFTDHMKLGGGVDAITGEVTKSALDSGWTTETSPSSGSSESYIFHFVKNVSEIESTLSAGLSASVTLPTNAFSAKSTIDFSHSQTSSGSTQLILLDWTATGQNKAVKYPSLSAEAKLALKSNPATFRDKYGDYFIYEIKSRKRFTAIWKCTAVDSSTMTSFSREISGSLTVDGVKGEGTFTAKLYEKAEKHGVTVEVQYMTSGDTGSETFEYDDVVKTFNAFKKIAVAVPEEVLLHHYVNVDPAVPLTINMKPNDYQRMVKVFSLAQFVLLLIGIVPGVKHVRLDRQVKIKELYAEVFSQRENYLENPSAMIKPLEQLENMKRDLWRRLERQDLVTELRSTTYEDMKRPFTVDHENDNEGGAAWIHSSENVGYYVLGRTQFSDEDKKRYAIERSDSVEVHVGSVLFSQQVGSLALPGTTSMNGYIVGLTVQSAWKDGTNGYWSIHKDLHLGTLTAKIGVKTDGSRGMHWRLWAHYIPRSAYDE